MLFTLSKGNHCLRTDLQVTQIFIFRFSPKTDVCNCPWFLFLYETKVEHLVRGSSSFSKASPIKIEEKVRQMMRDYKTPLKISTFHVFRSV